jgi:hypothetical protein
MLIVGVGNTTILTEYRIETLVDLPGVGKNLQVIGSFKFSCLLRCSFLVLKQEHLFFFMQWELKPGALTFGTLFTTFPPTIWCP